MGKVSAPKVHKLAPPTDTVRVGERAPRILTVCGFHVNNTKRKEPLELSATWGTVTCERCRARAPLEFRTEAQQREALAAVERDRDRRLRALENQPASTLVLMRCGNVLCGRAGAHGPWCRYGRPFDAPIPIHSH